MDPCRQGTWKNGFLYKYHRNIQYAWKKAYIARRLEYHNIIAFLSAFAAQLHQITLRKIGKELST